MKDDNFLNQTEIAPKFQGRKQFMCLNDNNQFNQFILSISDPEEWSQWKTFVEGDLTSTQHEFDEATKQLNPGYVFIVDQENKHMHYMNKETWKANLD